MCFGGKKSSPPPAPITNPAPFPANDAYKGVTKTQTDLPPAPEEDGKAPNANATTAPVSSASGADVDNLGM
jgi:hypothetical protein